MTNNDYWQDFERSGKIGDYLRYALGTNTDTPITEPDPAPASDRDVINIDNR